MILEKIRILKEFYFKLYKKDIPELGFEIDKNREVLHFELYSNKFNWNNVDSIIDIFVPVQEEI